MASLDRSQIQYPDGYLADVAELAGLLSREGVAAETQVGLIDSTIERLERGAEIRSRVVVDLDSFETREIAEFQRIIAFAFDTAVVIEHGADGEPRTELSEDQVAAILEEYGVGLQLVQTSIGSWHGVIEMVTSHAERALKYVALAGAVLGVIAAATPLGAPVMIVGAVLSGLPPLAAIIPGLDGLGFRGRSVRVPRAAATIQLRTEFLYHYVIACEPGTDDKLISKFRAHLLLDADDFGIDKSSFRTTQQEDVGSPKHIQFTTSRPLTYDELNVVDGYLERANVPAFWVQRPQPPATGTQKP
jgi:hypothetical protein